MRSNGSIPWAALSGVLLPLLVGLAPSAGAAGARSDVLPLAEVRRGMKGYGLTVFEGTRPERFDVEVIDVLRNFRPRQDLILVKTQHPRLEVAKVVAGMSGSPIYLGGKMAGAYAYGWTFGAEPVAGVTPIQSMLEDLDRPLPKLIDGWRLDVPSPGGPAARGPAAARGRYLGALEDYSVREHGRALAVAAGAPPTADAASAAGLPVAALRPVATPLLLGGLGAGAARLAGELLGPLGLEPLQAGGGGAAEADAPTRFEDGGAIGVQMIRGDMSATGLGTVTRVEGDRLVAFGHPMMESGVTALPTAVGRVLWFLASTNRSFKIGMPVRPLGALVNDRQASIVVSHAARAPVIPVTLSLKGVPGAPHTEWKFEVAHEKFMTPSFVSVALGSAVQAAAADRQDVTWVARSRLAIRGHGEIALEDQGLSIGGTPDPREFVESSLVRAIGAVLNNPWESALVERVHVDLELRYARDVLRLRGATLLDPQVYAGGTARVRLALESFAGPTTTKVVDIPIPRHLAGQTVTLTLQPGYSVTKERPAAERLADLIANLTDPVYPPKSLVVSYPVSPGVSFRGKVADNLPPGALDSIRPETASIAPETHRSEVRHVFALPSFLNGQDRVSLAVKPVLR